MVLRVEVVRIETSLLKSYLNCLLYLLLLSLLNSNLVLLILNCLGNRSLVESDRLHSSHLHSYLVTSVLVVLVELYHCAESVLAHVVINLDVLTLEYLIAVELHLLASDARALCNSSLNVTLTELESLHLVESVALCSDGSVENVRCKLNEVSTVSNEVGLALESDHGSKAVNILNENTTVRCLAVRTLSSDSESTLTEQLLCLIEITFCLSEGLLYVCKTSTSHGTKFLDVFN